jgi:lipopolysaccharide transport system ATP-binding protein
LSGRENIYMNGSILGMKRGEIARRFDEIVEFAEIGRFLDTAVKRYSSGMYVRLAFAVAAHLEPDILIVDEVLAVGDMAFQKRCLGKMNDVALSGRTVLFVSHNHVAVQELTTRCLLLERGALSADGPSSDIVQQYVASVRNRERQLEGFSNRQRPLSDLPQTVELLSAHVAQQSGLPLRISDTVPLIIEVVAREAISSWSLSLTLSVLGGATVGSSFSEDMGPLKAGERAVYELSLEDLPIAPGHYGLNLATGSGDYVTGRRTYDVIMEAVDFEVYPRSTEEGTLSAWDPSFGALVIAPPTSARVG